MTRNTRGFTLIELLAATAMSAVLMLSVLIVIGSIGQRHSVTPPAMRAGAGRLGELMEVIRMDLVNAREIAVSDDGIRLFGFGSIDRSTLAPNHRPVVVMYRIREMDRGRILTRSQRRRYAPRIDDGGPVEWSEMLASGVTELSIQPLEAKPRAQGPTTRPLTMGGPDAELLTPRVRVTIRFDTPDRPTLDEVLIVR